MHVSFQSALLEVHALLEAGRLEEAAVANAALRERYPERPFLLLQHARIERAAGRYLAARAAVLETIGRSMPPAAVVHQVAMLDQFHLEEALDAVIDGLEAPALQHAPLMFKIAEILVVRDMPDRALAWIDRIDAIEPGNIGARLLRAQASLYLGRFEASDAQVSEVLVREPSNSGAWWLRARLPRVWSPGETRELRLQASDQRRPAPDRVLLLYALHHVLHGSGDFEGAATALSSACELQRDALTYRPENFEALLAALGPGCDLPTPRTGGFDTFKPIFIVGLHRTGTTLLDRLLARHPDVESVGEHTGLTVALRELLDSAVPIPCDLRSATALSTLASEEIASIYTQMVRRRVPVHRVVNKLPQNFMLTGLILAAFPDARILWLQREPMATCFSNLRELFPPTIADYTFDQRELARAYKAQQSFMAAWAQHESDRVMPVDYDALVSRTEAVMRSVAEFCGLTFIPDMLDPRQAGVVSTASVVRVRDGVDRASQGTWQHYAALLTGLRDAFGT